MPFVFRKLTLYEQASGAKINKTKTTGLLIGALKGKIPHFNEISWTKDNMKTLGISHGFNVDTKAIYASLIKKITNCLNTWGSRNLTLKGKVLVIKTYVISKLLYEAEVNGIPQPYIDKIEKMIKRFLWDGKQPLINKNTCHLNNDDRGLGLPNIETIIKTLNIKTIYRLIIHSDVQN